MLKDDLQDEKLYAAAAAELDGDGRDEGLWAKCFAECDGDEKKVKARYLKIRVERLRPATSEEEASTPPVIEDSEVAPVPPVETVAEPRRSYKSWIIGCLGVLLLVGAIGISAGWWMYSQRYVLTESEAHSEMVFRIKPNEDSDNPGEVIPITDEAKQQVMEALKNRLKDYGVAHSVVGNGEVEISVKLPSLTSSELKVVRGVLTNHGKLEFRLSHPDSESLVNELVSLVRGAERMRYVQKDNSGEQFVSEHFILKEVALSGKHIKSASAQRNDLTGKPEIHFTLDPIGANKFAKVTERHSVGNGDERLLAMVVNGELVSAPSINGRIHSRGQITGDFTFEEATELANALVNPFKNELELISSKDLK